MNGAFLNGFVHNTSGNCPELCKVKFTIKKFVDVPASFESIALQLCVHNMVDNLAPDFVVRNQIFATLPSNKIINHMNDLQYTIEDNKLFESIADIAFMAGQRGFCSGDSRSDVAEFIKWGKEFEDTHEDTDWDEQDYLETIEAFLNTKLRIDLQ